jgi:probable HAF family extracellular repeat protein
VATDLGTVGGDGCGVAVAINSKGQIVGKSESCDFSTARAFLWENGSMIDLNTVVPPGTLLYLVEANFTTDQGVIAGQGGLPTGEQHSFLLVPVCEDDTEGCEDAPVDPSIMIHNTRGARLNNSKPA